MLKFKELARKKVIEKQLENYGIKTENTLKIIKTFRKYSDKEILIKDIREAPDNFPISVSYLGATYDDAQRIIVYLNFSHLNTCEATFIHEMLHIILRCEGFPKVLINPNVAETLPFEFNKALPKLQAHFSSTVDHPTIFKRLETEFNLDLSSYYDAQIRQKLNRFNKSRDQPKTDPQYHFYRQQDILIGLEYFFYPQNYRVKITAPFNELYPDAYASCLSLYEKVKRIGFDTPDSAYKSAQIIKDHIIKYGKRKGVGLSNKMWEALEIKL